MTSLVIALRWSLRILFLISLTLGILLWSGAAQYLRLHMWLGFAITFILLIESVLGFVARLRPTLPLIALLWAISLPVIGIAQLRIMPGASHWIIQVIHLLLGIGAIGVGEVLGKRTVLTSSV